MTGINGTNEGETAEKKEAVYFQIKNRNHTEEAFQMEDVQININEEQKLSEEGKHNASISDFEEEEEEEK